MLLQASNVELKRRRKVVDGKSWVRFYTIVAVVGVWEEGVEELYGVLS